MTGKHEDIDARLAVLAETHTSEELAEANRSWRQTPRPLSVSLPRGGSLPISEAWLERLYANGRVAKEKKPIVFDHLRSYGGYMVSVDDKPLSVLDSMSQTATLCGGFAEDPVVKAYAEGRFAGTILESSDSTVVDHPVLDEYRKKMIELCAPLKKVTFTNSGAEAGEKALTLCKANAEKAKQTKVLAFESAFHGRMLLPLHATYNPAKRERFELHGYEASFAPFPHWGNPEGPEPRCAQELMDHVADTDFEGARQRFGGLDPLLDEELRCLEEAHKLLDSGQYFAVVVEPMQSEGGDRYATARFFKCLRLLTRTHELPLVMDEVQTGFGLGGTFMWHSRFGLVDGRGKSDYADVVCFAKRAQLGVVVSNWKDPEPTAVHLASAVRGLVHAEWMASDPDASRVESHVARHLDRLSGRFPDLVLHARNRGYAFAFDLPSPASLSALIKQRFYRGAVVFQAGSQTARYRLSRGFALSEIDRVFEAIHGSLKWIEANEGEVPPAWMDLPGDPTLGVSAPPRHEVRLRDVSNAEDVDAIMKSIVELERRVYEPARRDPEEKLRVAFDDPGGIAIIAEIESGGETRVVGSVLGVPLERCYDVEGPKADPYRGRENALYSLALTVAPEVQGQGVGRRLKVAQLEAAAARRGPKGAPRYRHITGRNRVGHADAMTQLNRSLGAYEVTRLEDQYGQRGAEAIYYRILLDPLVPEVPPRKRGELEPTPTLDFASPGVALTSPPESLRKLMAEGRLFGATVNKLTLLNFVSPDAVRAIEWVGSLSPDHPHIYMGSSRDEVFDKSVRLMRCHRPEAQIAIGLEGGYVGHTAASARSLSDPDLHKQGDAFFKDWSRVPHPELTSAEAFEADLKKAIDNAGGAERVFGFFVEPIQERTGLSLSDAHIEALGRVREATGVPIVFIETTSAYYRSGGGPFRATSSPVVPDAIVWWAGGQMGFVHATPEMYVSKPFTLVSTWDGDELSLIRTHHQLRALREVERVDERIAQFEAALEPARKSKTEIRGSGLYRVLYLGVRAERVARALTSRGFRVRYFRNRVVAIAPCVNTTEAQFKAFREALARVIR